MFVAISDVKKKYGHVVRGSGGRGCAVLRSGADTTDRFVAVWTQRKLDTSSKKKQTDDRASRSLSHSSWKDGSSR